MDIKTAIENTKRIYLSDSSLNILLDFERVLDELDLYGFKYWSKGELVEGPKIERYWVSCTFMWPRQMMPDPRGAERLLPYGCKISYEKAEIQVPMQIEEPSDFRDDGSKRGKLVPVKVWLVKIEMPQELISDIEQGSVEIAGEEVDIEDVDDAYQKGFDEKAMVQQSGDPMQQQQQPQQPQMGMGGGMPGMGGGAGVPTI